MGQVQTTAPSLRSGFAWTFAGNAVNGLSQWVILSLIAKLSTTEILGQYALALAAAMPVAMLAHLNLRSVLATDVSGQHPFGDYFQVRLWTGVGGLVITACTGLLWRPFAPVGPAVILVGIALCCENFEDLYYGVMQRRERLDLIGKSMILRAVISILATAAFLMISRSAAAAAAGFLTGRLVTLASFDMRQGWMPVGNPVAPMNVFRAALPLGFVLLLISLAANIPRYTIEHHLSTSALGTFVAVNSFVTLGSAVMNSLGQTATTRLAGAWNRGDASRFRKLGVQLTGVALAVGIGGALVAALAGGFFLRLAYKPEFGEYQPLLVQMLLAGTLGYVGIILGYVLTSTRRFQVQLPLSMTVAATSAAVSLLAIPALGITGAVLALAAAATVQIAGQLLLLRESV